MKRDGVALSVGLFVLMSMMALAFMAMSVAKRSSFSGQDDGYCLVANFDNISGLRVRAPVRIAGVRVGKVVEISMDSQSYQAHVKINMNQGIEIPVDTSASIMTEGLLGGKYISLQPGFESNMLADRGQIVRTNSAMILENLIGKFLYSAAKKGGK